MNELKWWINKIDLTSSEINLLNVNHTEDFEIENFTKEEKDKLQKDFFNRMPFNDKLKGYSLLFNSSATNFINELFDKYVDDNTLVIHSEYEHDNVKKRLKKCKNTLEIKNNYIDYKQIKKFKKVFVYFIGTQISTGKVTEQYFFIKLKEYLYNNNIDTIFVLDAVQEMFILPRSYDIFDYIIGTFHSLITDFNLGLLITKDKNIKTNYYKKLKYFIPSLDIFLKRRYNLYELKYILYNHYYEYISNGIFEYDNTLSPNIFSLKTNKRLFNKNCYTLLSKYSIKIEGINNEIQFIRIRAQHFIKDSNLLIEGITILDNLLKEII